MSTSSSRSKTTTKKRRIQPSRVSMFSSSAARSAFGPPVVLANRTRLRLTDKYEYPFVVQANDYNITFITGTGALCGMNAYNNASIPAAPTTAGAAANVGMFTMWFSLSGVYIQFFTTAGVAAGVSYNSAITNYTEYSALFDEYKIDKVEVTMVYNNNNSSMNSPHVSAPVLLFVKDYDDNAFTSLAAMEQYSNFRAIQYGNSSGSNNGIQTITVKPKAQLFVETNSGSAVGMATTGWFDTSNANQQHFGLKGWYSNTEGTATALYIGCIQVFTKFHLRFRGSK